jgi:TolA-binding protein
LSYQEIHTISMGYFSPKVRSDDDLISEYYYNLSELYRSYHTDDDAIRERAQLVAIKALEIIYFMYPKSKRAPDALWDIANIIRDHAVVDMLGEEDCYRTILQEYPESLFAEEAGARIDNMEEQDTGATVKE